jgi:hypothetical protein
LRFFRTEEVADAIRNSKMKLIPNEAATVPIENTAPGMILIKQNAEMIESTIRITRP